MYVHALFPYVDNNVLRGKYCLSDFIYLYFILDIKDVKMIKIINHIITYNLYIILYNYCLLNLTI